MAILKVFILLQGLLLAARCDVRSRDQELQDEEEDQLKSIPHQQQGGWDHKEPYEDFGTGHHSAGAQKESSDVSETIHYPLEHGHVNRGHGSPSEDVSVDAEGGSAETYNNNHPTRMGYV